MLKFKPLTVEHIQDLIRKNGKCGVIDMQNFSQIWYQDGICRVGPAVSINNINIYLDKYNRCLTNQPLNVNQTINHAFQYGDHGSGWNFPQTIPDQVVGIKFVDWLGNKHEVRKGDSDFPALQTFLTAFGIIYELELVTVASYNLSLTIEKVKLNKINSVKQLLSSNDHVMVSLLPNSDYATLMLFNKTNLSIVGNKSMFDLAKPQLDNKISKLSSLSMQYLPRSQNVVRFISKIADSKLLNNINLSSVTKGRSYNMLSGIQNLSNNSIEVCFSITELGTVVPIIMQLLSDKLDVPATILIRFDYGNSGNLLGLNLDPCFWINISVLCNDNIKILLSGLDDILVKYYGRYSLSESNNSLINVDQHRLSEWLAVKDKYNVKK